MFEKCSFRFYVPYVYYYFGNYGGMPITDKNDTNILTYKNEIDKIIKNNIYKPFYELNLSKIVDSKDIKGEDTQNDE